MANEISVSQELRVDNGNQDFQKRLSFQADQASAGGPTPGAQSIGTSHETISVADLTNLGWAFVRNLDETNFLEIGVEVSSTFYPLLRLEPGESQVIRLSPSVTPYAQADTAACLLETYCFEA